MQGRDWRDGVDLDALVTQLGERVERRRQAGEYPAELDEVLARTFAAAAEAAVRRRRLDAGLARLASAAGVSVERIGLDSTLPGGAALHRLTARALRRQTEGVLGQVRELADAMRQVMTDLVAALPDAAPAAGLEERLRTLEQRVRSLEERPRDGGDEPR